MTCIGHSAKSSEATISMSARKNSQLAAGVEQSRKRRSLPLPLHCSTPKRRVSNNSSKVDSSTGDVEDDIQEKQQQWKLTNVLQFSSCADNCAKEIHGLNEYEILNAHAHVTSLTNHEKNMWLLQYFLLQCPRTENGEKDLKGMQYIIHGKEVCFDLWLEILSLSGTRYYRVRKAFLDNDGAQYTTKPSRSQQPKTMKAIAWMDSYFQRVGDKRPDKNWVYLPTCLTLTKIYEIMIEQLCEGDSSKCISYAKFCLIYKDEFKNVSIPKVCVISYCT